MYEYPLLHSVTFVNGKYKFTQMHLNLFWVFTTQIGLISSLVSKLRSYQISQLLDNWWLDNCYGYTHNEKDSTSITFQPKNKQTKTKQPQTLLQQFSF